MSTAPQRRLSRVRLVVPAALTVTMVVAGAAASSAALSACGDNGDPQPIDAATDAPIDVPTDAPVDAPDGPPPFD